MFVVGKIETTHAQWTVGEFTYAYLRVLRAIRKQDYIIAHASDLAFDLYLPAAAITLDLTCSNPVPVRVRVNHAMGVTPQDMTEKGFAIVAKTIMVEVTRELAIRCPKRTSCMCRLHGIMAACGTALGQQEFRIDGMIANPSD